MKKKSIKTLKRELWKVLADYIKLRDSVVIDGTIYVKCATCDNIYVYNDRRINAGHFFSSRFNPVIRYNEYNIHAQCVACNINQGEQYIMSKYIEKNYGKRILERLESLRKRKYTFKRKKYEQYIKYYKHKRQEILKRIEREIYESSEG